MITEVLTKLGAWDITLSPDTPQEIIDALEYFGHVAFFPGLVHVDEWGDDLLGDARYVGVFRGLKRGEQYDLSGSGLALWLGDEDGKGAVYETAKTFDGATFADTIRALLPAAVQEGTIHSVAGTYTGSHQWQSPRQAIDYVCDTFGAEWRINPDGTFDAGLPGDLFVTEPKAIVVRKDAGTDMALRGHQGDLETDRDIQDWSTRVVLLAEGEGESIATGAADTASNPYRDLFGNPVVRTRLVSESGTSQVNANTRAQIALNRYLSDRKSIRLSANDYLIEGDYGAGDNVYVYDPASGLVNPNNEVEFRGEIINPMVIRVVEVTFPVKDGYTVAFRDNNGGWHDLTPFVEYEGGGASIVVGEGLRRLTKDTEPISPRVNAPAPDGVADDGTIPDAPTLNTPWSTQSYLDAEGNTRAYIVVDWNRPLNTDGSTITDGDRYEIRWRNLGSTDYSYTAVGFDITQASLRNLDPGVTYQIGVRAVDQWGNGTWSADVQMNAQSDTVPPSTPAAPTVAGNVLDIQVTHTLGVSTGGTYNLESDLDHLEVHASTAGAGFTISAATLVGKMQANHAMLQAQVPAIATFVVPDTAARYVKVVAVDKAGNKSAASAAAAVTAQLIDTAHITDAAITNAKIDSLAASKITAGNMMVGSYIRSSSYSAGSTGWTINADGSVEFNSGTFRGTLAAASGTFAGNLSAAGGTFTGTLSGVDGTFTGTISADQISGGTITGATLRTASTGYRTEIGYGSTGRIRFYSGGGYEVDPGYILSSQEYLAAYGGYYQTMQIVGARNSNATYPPMMEMMSYNGTRHIKFHADQMDIPGYSLSGHTHNYASTTHTHDYAATNHTHSSLTASGETWFVGSYFFGPSVDGTEDVGRSGQRTRNVFATNGTIATSDESIKHEIHDSALGLNFVRELRPISWKWTDSPREREVRPHDRRHYGLGAEEVRDVLGRLGISTSDFGGFVDPTADGQDGPLGLRYHEFIAPLVKAIQELDAEVQALKAANQTS